MHTLVCKLSTLYSQITIGKWILIFIAIKFLIVENIAYIHVIMTLKIFNSKYATVNLTLKIKMRARFLTVSSWLFCQVYKTSQLHTLYVKNSIKKKHLNEALFPFKYYYLMNDIFQLHFMVSDIFVKRDNSHSYIQY